MPKVSVIVPIYGVEKYIERCARSLFEQTLDDIEYIFINDCTKDRSIEVLEQTIEEYPQRKEQIRIENMPTNSGQAAVRRHGIQLATSDYIIHCDSDDYMDLDMLEKMFCKICKTDADIVMVDVYKEFSDYKLLIKAPYNDDIKKIRSEFIRGNAIYQWNKLIKKELYLEFISYLKTGYDMSEDFSIIVPLSFKAKKIEYVPDTYYHYIQYNTNAITKKTASEKEIKGWLYSVECIESYLKDNKITGYEQDIIFRKLIIRYWCMKNTFGKEQYKYSKLYPEINAHAIYLTKQFGGIRSKLLYYLISKGYIKSINTLAKLNIISFIG